MSSEVSQQLKKIGSDWMKWLASFHIVYDNMNQYQKVWHQSIDTKAELESGTAAMLIMQPNVAPDAFDGHEYEAQRLHINPHDITINKVWNDIDSDHLKKVSILNILHLLLQHVPGLQHHKDEFERFQKECEKHMADPHVSRIIPLETSGYDKVTTLGNWETVCNIIERQLGIPPDAVEGHLIPTSGDCATIAHLQTLKHNMSSGSTWFSSNRFILPLIKLWHMKFAMLKGIIKAHWPKHTEKGDEGLHLAANRLHRRLNPNKIDFYPMEMLVEVVLTAMTLNFIQYVAH